MRHLFRRLYELNQDEGFTRFQNRIAQRLYNSLGEGFARGENEVALVGRLVKAVSGESYGPITLHGAMLHGTRSYVEYNYLDQPVTKELGDMALVSIATHRAERVVQRLTIIQNKKTGGKRWDIDPAQLFMLKNFPPFAGNRGIFRGHNDVTFRNRSGCLGSYGLLGAPGDMLFASAPLISEFARGKKSVSQNDISFPAGSCGSAFGLLGESAVWWPQGLYPREWFHVLEEMFLSHTGGIAVFPGAFNPLGNRVFARDLYDLTRAWTSMSIGEPTTIGGTVVNSTVDAFANYLLASGDMSQMANLPPSELFGDRQFEGNIGILAVHLDLGE